MTLLIMLNVQNICHKSLTFPTDVCCTKICCSPQLSIKISNWTIGWDEHHVNTMLFWPGSFVEFLPTRLNKMEKGELFSTVKKIWGVQHCSQTIAELHLRSKLCKFSKLNLITMWKHWRYSREVFFKRIVYFFHKLVLLKTVGAFPSIH